MRSLFVKIFVCYWLAQALFFILAILVASALRPSREISNLQAQQTRFLSEALQAYQTGGETAARKYLRNIHDMHHVHLFIFDDAGKDILGRSIPGWVERAKRGDMSTADTFWGRFRPTQFLRASTTGPDGRRYTVITDLQPEPHPWFLFHGAPGLGVLIGILSSGFVSYLLARYLTSPILRLRAATQRLAGGDLSARAGVPTAGRHDEIAELMRDFDRMAERIENLVAAQNRLLTDISHELRSPLARLNVALELARQRSGSEAASALERIDRESTRLNEMIQRLLTLARLESGEDQLEKCPVDLEQLVREIAKDASFEAQSRRSHVEVHIADNSLVDANPSLLHSAIENVVRNAIRYTEEGTSVDIHLGRTDAAPAEAMVRVSDSGPGVPEEALDKLFRPFYRIDDARRRQTGGVGLGLSITARAVELSGGSVEARNRAQGGLIIEIRLPLLARELPKDAALETPVPVSGGSD
jgi:two-component system, OmpR family, sensor histidine kinase CpxA